MKTLTTLTSRTFVTCLLFSLCTAVSATPISYKKDFETASWLNLSVQKTSTEADGMASEGDFNKANLLLLMALHIQSLNNSNDPQSSSQKAELIIKKLKKTLGQRILEVHHPESCKEKESRGA